MIAPNSIVSTNTIEPVIASIRRIAPSIRTGLNRPEAHGGRPAEGAANATAGACRDQAWILSGRDPRLVAACAAEKEMHRVGVAVVQLTRSTFAEATAGRESLQPRASRARCSWKLTVLFCARQAPKKGERSQIATIAFLPEIFRRNQRDQAEMHRVRCSLVRPPNRPPPKRLPVGGPSTSGAPSSVHPGHYGPDRRPSSVEENEKSHFAFFL